MAFLLDRAKKSFINNNAVSKKSSSLESYPDNNPGSISGTEEGAGSDSEDSLSFFSGLQKGKKTTSLGKVKSGRVSKPKVKASLLEVVPDQGNDKKRKAINLASSDENSDEEMGDGATRAQRAKDAAQALMASSLIEEEPSGIDEKQDIIQKTTSKNAAGIKKTKDLLNKLNKLKTNKRSNVTARRGGACSGARSPEVEDGLFHTIVTATKILTAAERDAIAAKNKYDFSVDVLEEVLGSDARKVISNSNGSDGGGALCEGITLKIRLNGKDTQIVNIPLMSQMRVLRKKVAKLYGLCAEKDIKSIVFDGDTLEDNKTADFYDMEDDCLIDVNIAPGLYANAVAAVAKNAPVPSPTPAMEQSNSVSKSVCIDPSDVIRIKTRLNGIHEHKFGIKKSEGFGQLKAKYAQIYGLQLDQLKEFSFDAEELDDDETPEGIDMEDDDLVDVKIDSALLKQALDHKAKFLAASSSSSSFFSSSASSSSFSVAVPELPEENEVVEVQRAEGEKAENRIKYSLNFTVAAEVHPQRQEVGSITIQLFADQTLRSIATALHKKKLLDVDCPSCFMHQSEILDMDKTLFQLSIYEGSNVVIRMPSITIDVISGKSTPISLSVDPAVTLDKLVATLKMTKTKTFTVTNPDKSKHVLKSNQSKDKSLYELGFQDGCKLKM